VAASYNAVFDNYPKLIPNSFAGSALKHAADHGAVEELTQHMQAAVEAGKPMDFDAFARMLNERSVGRSVLQWD
jgi:hypothetical protein